MSSSTEVRPQPPDPREPVYKGELAVGTIPNVNVGQGSTVTSDISDTYDNVSREDRSMVALIGATIYPGQ